MGGNLKNPKTSFHFFLLAKLLTHYPDRFLILDLTQNSLIRTYKRLCNNISLISKDKKKLEGGGGKSRTEA